MIARSRPWAPLIAAATLLALGGCGASSSKAPVPEARDAVGGYRLTTVISHSTITTNKAGASSRVSTSLFLSCADATCTALDQRSAGTGVPQGATVRLTPGPGGFSGQHIRSGPCGGTIAGNFGESFTWAWKRGDDGALTGSMKQVFHGCDLDGTTTYEASATRVPGLALPYLPTRAQSAWIAAVDRYDAGLGEVYVSGTECNTDPSTTTVREARCFARTYAAWRPDVDRLARATARAATKAGSTCRTALDAVRPADFSRVVRAAAEAYDAARTKAGVRAAVKAEGTATSFATGQHALLVTALALCTDPARAGELGIKGSLQLDPDSVLQPLAG
ncbi:MAG: hypothetical protein ACJ72E_03730 [Marmoricola sp.]